VHNTILYEYQDKKKWHNKRKNICLWGLGFLVFLFRNDMEEILLKPCRERYINPGATVRIPMRISGF
jgi:hypothetical protein